MNNKEILCDLKKREHPKGLVCPLHLRQNKKNNLNKTNAWTKCIRFKILEVFAMGHGLSIEVNFPSSVVSIVAIITTRPFIIIPPKCLVGIIIRGIIHLWRFITKEPSGLPIGDKPYCTLKNSW